MSDDMILGTDAFGHSVMSGNTFYVFVDENGNRIQPKEGNRPMRIIIGKRDSVSGVNTVEMRDRQFSADATYVSKMETPSTVTLEMEEGAERILLVVQNGDRSKWVIEENEIGDQWLYVAQDSCWSLCR